MRRISLILCTLVALALGASSAQATSSRSAWASWYGPGLYGNSMACGGVLSAGTWAVAHKWLPCGTRVTVCYRRCVTAPVRDRGPYVAGRDFDLTYPVKRAIGMGGTGRIRWYIQH